MSVLTEDSGRGDVILFRDAVNRWGVEWQQSTDGATFAPKDLSGWAGELVLKSSLGETWARLPATTSANGVTTFTVTPDTLKDPAWDAREGGDWHVTITAPDGHTERLADGYFHLEAATVAASVEPEPDPDPAGGKDPVGTVTMWLTGPIPEGKQPLDGRNLSRTEYHELFSLIGTTYGPGDGVSTFALPNFNGRVPVGLDLSQPEFNSPGRTGGAKTHALTAEENAKHSHTDHFWNVVVSKGGNTGTWAPSPGTWLRTAGEDGDYPAGRQTGDSGEGKPHNNLQPYLTVQFLVQAN
ncbi:MULTISPECIES: phage tail protein [Bacteria]|uniref:phage tail protein n=1 Tax=Bacteria TaxID=2 RepID=UPI003C7999F7